MQNGTAARALGSCQTGAAARLGAIGDVPQPQLCSLHTGAAALQQAKPGAAQGQQADGANVVEQDDPYSSLSTKVTPVSTPEAASWSLVIVAAYALTATLGYVVVSQLFMQSPEAAAFDAALGRVRDDMRVTVRLGDRIKGFGGSGASGGRKARHQISHNIYNDSHGKQHVQVQFNISGQGQRGIVSADMFKEGSTWECAYCFVDIGSDRIIVQAPDQAR